eukprot:5989561-Lingulodinium_polyedra.AAC.1
MVLHHQPLASMLPLAPRTRRGLQAIAAFEGRCSAGAGAARPKLLQESMRPLAYWIGPAHHHAANCTVLSQLCCFQEVTQRIGAPRSLS